MKIDSALTSCKVAFDYASNPRLIQVFILLLLVIIPLVKIALSIIKTFKKTKEIEQRCSQKIPSKLAVILKKHNIDKNLFVISCDKNYTAVSIGFFSKKIILSRYLTSLISLKELEAIVLHEVYHTKFNHSLLLFLSELFTSTFFFLPFLKDLQLLVKLELEKAADQYAVTFQNTTKYVKSSLKKVLIADNSFGLFPQFSYQEIDQRIDGLNSKKTRIIFSRKRLAQSIFAVIVLISLFFINSNNVMASEMENKICTAYANVNNPIMSPVNLSIDRLAN